jgi:hypothetical protein
LNIVPDCRVQLTCTGAAPPAVVGGEKVTTAGLLAAATVKLVGHVIDSGVGAGGCGVGGRAVGPVGDEHAGASITSVERNASAHRQFCARRLATLFGIR